MEFKSEQLENIFDISVTDSVLNACPNINDFKDKQFENIYLILVTFGVSNSDKSRLDINEQWSNIYSISITFETLKPDKSIDFKDLHSPKV